MKNYKNKKCWQAIGFTQIKKGIAIDQKLESTGWLMIYVKWDDKSYSWEKIVNLSFDMKQIGEIYEN
tara:strand:+ start:809 stop:1009 length:201 start_codon:yes stop_codon:yes gene_type:complete